MIPWKWQARRALKPLRDEMEDNAEQVTLGTPDWQRWWRDTGERELECILMTAWDPIGVADAPEAWGEYHDYMPGVLSCLRDAEAPNVAAERIAEYLDHVEVDWMETRMTRKRREANRSLAEALVAWHQWSFDHGGRTPPLD